MSQNPTTAPTAPSPGPQPVSRVDFAGGFNDLLRPVLEANPRLFEIATLVGVVLVVIGIFLWAKSARRGKLGGASLKPVGGSLILGTILVAPTLIIPILLGAVDILVNIVLTLAGA